jgi:predicted HD phosphohydrolase
VLAHGLQCGALLRARFADDPELAVAGLLHDIADIAVPGAHREHDLIGAELVRDLLGARVAHLVASHVAAKRYLVATDRAYTDLLSARSLQTLHAQGDAMPDAELEAFERDPDFAAIVALRRADEQAKDPRASVPGLEHWRALVGTLILTF